MPVEKSTKSVLDECWEWKGGRAPAGYGMRRIRGVHQGLHRVAWAWANGPIPPGMFVCHRCDNPPCVNPKHLFLGTQKDNMVDMLNKGRHHLAARTTCKRGHPLSGTNLRLKIGKTPGSKSRTCIACTAFRNSQRDRRKEKRC